MGCNHMPKTYVFKGTKEVTKEQILDQLGFLSRKTRPLTGVIAGARDGLSAESIARFLVPASECEFALNSVSLSTFNFSTKKMNSVRVIGDNKFSRMIYCFHFLLSSWI